MADSIRDLKRDLNVLSRYQLDEFIAPYLSDRELPGYRPEKDVALRNLAESVSGGIESKIAQRLYPGGDPDQALRKKLEALDPGLRLREVLPKDAVLALAHRLGPEGVGASEQLLDAMMKGDTDGQMAALDQIKKTAAAALQDYGKVDQLMGRAAAVNLPDFPRDLNKDGPGKTH